ncbi:unnamed protein product, partial [Brassica oleracea]
KQRVWILLALYHQSQESYIHVNLRILHLKCLLLMVLFLDILLFTRSKPGEERPGGSCSWILVTLNAEKVVNLLTARGVFYLNWDVLLSKAWRRGAEVQSPKTRDGITTNENGDHDYVEYNNSSTTSTCQDHSPWLSA